jgi:hypothetical protein
VRQRGAALTRRTRSVVGEGGGKQRGGADTQDTQESSTPRMNSDNCELLKWISNDFDLFFFPKVGPTRLQKF